MATEFYINTFSSRIAGVKHEGTEDAVEQHAFGVVLALCNMLDF